MRSFAVATAFISVFAQAALDSNQHETRGIHDYAFHGCASSPKLGDEFRNVFSTSNRTSLFPAICGSICHELYVATVRGDCYCAAEIKSPVDFSATECSDEIPTIWIDQRPEIGPQNGQTPDEPETSPDEPEKNPGKTDKGSSNDNTITFPDSSGDGGSDPILELPDLDIPDLDELVIEEPKVQAPEHVEHEHDADCGCGSDELEHPPPAAEVVCPEGGCEEPDALAPEPEHHAPQEPQHEQPPVTEALCPEEGCEQTPPEAPEQEPQCLECVEPQPPVTETLCPEEGCEQTPPEAPEHEPQCLECVESQPPVTETLCPEEGCEQTPPEAPVQEPQCLECVEPQPPVTEPPKPEETKLYVPVASNFTSEHPAPTEDAPNSEDAETPIQYHPDHQPQSPHEPVAPGSRTVGSVFAALMVCGFALLI